MTTLTDSHGSFVPFLVPGAPCATSAKIDHARQQAQRQAANAETQLLFNLTPFKLNPLAALERLIPVSSLQAQNVKVPCVLAGVLREPQERHAYWFELTKNQRIWLRAEAKKLNSPVDIDFVIIDKNGREVRRPEQNREPLSAEFTAGTAGIYGVLVRDVLQGGSLAHMYQVEIMDQPPLPVFLAEVEGICVPQNSWQAIPINISKPGGNWKLSLHNAPPGMRLSPDRFPDGKSAMVCQLHASRKTPLGVQSIQIIAEDEGATPARRVVIQTQPLIDRQLHNVDLIPIGLREDQKRLPPSLTDRLALQVTPPTPFDAIPPETVLVPRYQQGRLPITINRDTGSTGEIRFTAKGGQLGPKTEGRTRVYAELPTVDSAGTRSDGWIQSLILSNLGKTRVDLVAILSTKDREIRLQRPFEMNLIRVFSSTASWSKSQLQPGEQAQVIIECSRVPSFTGPITFTLNQNANSNVVLPERVTISAGQTRATVAAQIPATANPGKYRIDIHATALVDGFEEEERNQLPEIEIKKTEPLPKKSP